MMVLHVYHNPDLTRPLAKLAKERGYKRKTKRFDNHFHTSIVDPADDANYAELFDLLDDLPRDRTYSGHVACNSTLAAVRFACHNKYWKQIACLPTGALYITMDELGAFDGDDVNANRDYLYFEQKVDRVLTRRGDGLPPLEHDWPDDVLTPVDLDDGPEEDC
jgi:hypothetical protein